MLEIYNTLTHKKEIFKPIEPGKIKLYVCGVTVDGFCHMGHARIFVFFDTMVRFLTSQGWQVEYVRNITDVDDKIIKKAAEQSMTTDALTAHFIQAMYDDTESLNVLRPTLEPKATEYIQTMQSMIGALMDKKVAYQGKNQDIFFSIDQYKAYGELSNRDTAELKSGSRVEIDINKQNPLDFVLWKHAKKDELAWESPWGPGRPGWHIECSAMSTHCLGDTFDIHGGGHDLVFPHHENERAQAECATDKKFVNTWMHVGFIQVDKLKMSKSLNNFFTIREVLKDHNPEVIRYFLMSGHYRSPINYSIEQLTHARASVDRLYQCLRSQDVLDNFEFKESETTARFVAAMEDDFNTPEALAVLFSLVHEINTTTDNHEKSQLIFNLMHLGKMIGLLYQNPEQYFQGQTSDADNEIDRMIIQRDEARRNKNWKLADEIRDTLSSKNIILEDKDGKTIWRKG